MKSFQAAARSAPAFLSHSGQPPTVSSSCRVFLSALGLPQPSRSYRPHHIYLARMGLQIIRRGFIRGASLWRIMPDVHGGGKEKSSSQLTVFSCQLSVVGFQGLSVLSVFSVAEDSLHVVCIPRPRSGRERALLRGKCRAWMISHSFVCFVPFVVDKGLSVAGCRLPVSDLCVTLRPLWLGVLAWGNSRDGLLFSGLS
jgi:hypothetical protein